MIWSMASSMAGSDSSNNSAQIPESRSTPMTSRVGPLLPMETRSTPIPMYSGSQCTTDGTSAPFRSNSPVLLRIIGSGPHRNAVVRRGRNGRRRRCSVTNPKWQARRRPLSQRTSVTTTSPVVMVGLGQGVFTTIEEES
jgi:hypothetical protein